MFPSGHPISSGARPADLAFPELHHSAGEIHALEDALESLDRAFVVVEANDRGREPSSLPAAAVGGRLSSTPSPGSRRVRALLPATPAESLGDPSFRRDHGVALAYVGGAMANGIASVELVTALARAGCLAFFGAAGLTVAEVARALDRLAPLGGLPHGINLIHAPNEPRVERELVELALARRVRAAEASAYLELTAPIVRFRVAGLRRGPDGEPVPARRLMAKVSRREVARRFLSPPPDELLVSLERDGAISAEERALARRLPMCDDLTAEADSGGHTDNRPLVTLVPSLAALRDEIARELRYASPPRVGAAGGIATPWSVHAAFSLGAAYVLVGSVHQSCVEAGTSDPVRALLAEAEPTDVAMAPAADMFELGVHLQVLRRGTMFAMRAKQLLELYRAHDSWDAIPPAERAKVEKTHFRASFEEIWARTREFFLARDPDQVARAERDAKHRLALVFRWYLGLSSAWANRGDPERRLDYQIWCGPAMGAFNEWARGSEFELPAGRRVAAVARALMEGAARLARAEDLRRAGIALPASLLDLRPRVATGADAPARSHA
jgi:PfaD family protein